MRSTLLDQCQEVFSFSFSNNYINIKFINKTDASHNYNGLFANKQFSIKSKFIFSLESSVLEETISGLMSSFKDETGLIV